MTHPTDSVETLIGQQLRQLRTIRGLTLDGLARRTGFTKGYLSKIENAHKIPPIATLSRISGVLNTDIAYFFQKRPEPESHSGKVSVVRAQERKRVFHGIDSFGYDFESIAYKKPNKSMEPFIFTFPEDATGETMTTERFSHEGEEIIFVLSGSVEFEVEDASWVLSSGDCVYIDSSLPHRGRALGGEAKALVVVYRPSADGEDEANRADESAEPTGALEATR